MQVDAATIARYQKESPELMDAVEAVQESPWIMRKDKASGYCVKFDGGLCGIHKQHGDRFLGDACHFYPRSTRKLGDQVVMTATLSCPEVARLALRTPDACALEAAETDRLPHSLKDYLPETIPPAEAISIHQAFLTAADDASSTAEQIFLRIASASRSIELIAKKDWAKAVPFYLKSTDLYAPPAETNPADPFNLLHALAGLIVASHKPMPERLQQTVSEMEQALSVTLDWPQVLIHTGDDSLPSYRCLRALWEQEGAVRHAAVLRRWLQMQLALSLYPFAGLGESLSDRIAILGVRLATVKLALMCACSIHGAKLPEDTVVRIVQSLSRFLDHLGDPAFSLAIYKETGWITDARMRGLLAG